MGNGDFAFDNSTKMEISEAIANKHRNNGSGSPSQNSQKQGQNNRGADPNRRSDPRRNSDPYRDPNRRRPPQDGRSSGSRPQARRRRKKQSSPAAAVLILLVVLAVVTGVVYLAGWSTSMNTFLKNTFINDVDVSGLTTAQAASKLSAQFTAPKVSIHTKSGNTVTMNLSEYGYTFDINTPVKKIYNEQDHKLWFKSLFETSDYTLEVSPTFDKDHFDRQLRRTTWGTTTTSDAKIAYGDSGYYIIPETYGDEVNIELLVKYVNEKLENGILDIDLSDADLYMLPEVTAEDLQSQLDVIKENFDFIITYDFDYTQEYLTGAQVYRWTNEGKDLDRSKVENFVADLAKKYDTFMTTRNFQTTERGTIQISQGRYSAGQYGWWIDQEKTVEKLLSYIEDGQSVTIDPVYVQLDTGYTYEGFESARTANDDIGNTYIEVDLTAQHLWYYKDGELAFETTNIVSGKATDPNRKTPGGIYSVYTKSTNYTMVAPDGSYRAPCSYFMRLSFEGIGLHDLSRAAYGGNTYINNGSHGCINMKYAEVKELYNMVERGTPAILYY